MTIAVVVEGSFQYRSARGAVLMSPGALLLGNCGRRFECRHEHGSGDRCVAVHYTPEFFERARETAAFPLHRIPPLAVMAPWVAKALLAIRAPEKVGFEELAHGLADAVLNILKSNGQGRRAPTAADERRISGTLRFIEANLREPLPLQWLASAARMSEFHFLRVFKQVTGATPHQYVLRARLRQAALRLRSSPDAVLDVALDAGFGDLSNFNHAFRVEFGVSPRAYRGRSRGKG